MIIETRRNQYNSNSRSSTEESEPITPCQDSLYSFKFSQSPWKDYIPFIEQQQKDVHIPSISNLQHSFYHSPVNSTITSTDTTSYQLQQLQQYNSSSNSSSNNSSSSSSSSLNSNNNNNNNCHEHHLYNQQYHYYNNNIDHYLPQNQAIITTTEENEWSISLANSIATQLFDYEEPHDLVEMNILDLIDSSYHSLLLSEIANRRKTLDYCGGVLICGEVIPILKRGGKKASASLWLKEKKQDETSVFIWIFEQVIQNVVTLNLDTNNDTILSASEEVTDLFGYSTNEVASQSITLLIPQYHPLEKYFISQSKKGIRFPIIVEHPNLNVIRITSIPTLSGLVTVKDSQIVESCNAVFAKYLFGYSVENLINIPITQLLPQFPTILNGLKQQRQQQSHDSSGDKDPLILNNLTCRQILLSANRNTNSDNKDIQQHSLTNKEDSLPVITAIHRDGTPFEIGLQIRLGNDISNNNNNKLALWISLDRDSITTTYQTKATPISKQIDKYTNDDATAVINASSEKKEPSSVQNMAQPRFGIRSISRPTFSNKKSKDEPNTEGQQKEPILTKSIDDYEIIDELGQGTYGFVKLAYHKKDTEKKKRVIKYVVKSRILVDCWTRDRKLGLIPAEIHVLLNLQRIPHENCCEMLDYFEDDDYYYIVMDLYGAGMDLFDYIELKNGGMSEPEIRAIFRQIVSAVNHLHSNKIVHRDIKDENVILDLKDGVRLIDFGSAAYLKGKKFETFVGTLDYAAPEILRGESYTGLPQDIWACGILLFTLIYRETPFYNVDEIMQGELRVPFALSEDSLDLIKKMLERDVEKRLTIDQVLDHPWLNCD